MSHQQFQAARAYFTATFGGVPANVATHRLAHCALLVRFARAITTLDPAGPIALPADAALALVELAHICQEIAVQLDLPDPAIQANN